MLHVSYFSFPCGGERCLPWLLSTYLEKGPALTLSSLPPSVALAATLRYSLLLAIIRRYSSLSFPLAFIP